MEIKDGGFAIKVKNLREEISVLRGDVCDSGLAPAINGENDIVEAEKLIDEMFQLQLLMDGQVKMLSEKIKEEENFYS